MKHTRGPWSQFVWDKTKPHIRTIGARITEGDLDHMCYLSHPNAEADARLIAAAPELLEALKGAALLIQNQLSPEGRQNVLKKIDAAIAKAEVSSNE